MPVENETAPEGPDEIVQTRRYDAPRALVWRAWTTPEHLDVWWGPAGFTTTTQSLRLAEGGQWLFTMRGPDGTVWPNGIAFTEVRPAERLVYEHGDGTPGAAPHFHVVVTFSDDDGGGTLLTMRARFPSVAARRFVVENVNAIEGGRQTLERLAQYVQTLA